MTKILAACAASFVLVAGGAVAQAVGSQAPQATTSSAPVVDGSPSVAMPHELPGEATTMRLCSQCHSFASATQRDHTRDEWNGIIGRMIEQGLTAPDEELMEVSDYLTANHGPPAA